MNDDHGDANVRLQQRTIRNKKKKGERERERERKKEGIEAISLLELHKIAFLLNSAHFELQ